jgi:hypothetical protein
MLAILAGVAISVQSAGAEFRPSRVLLNITDDPARKAAVSWRTESATEAKGQIAIASPDPRFVKDAITVNAESVPVTVPNGKTVYYAAVRFMDLKPSTQYAYRVGSEKGWSEWIHFTTASDKPAPFNFVYFGDAQNDIKSMWSRAVRRAFRDLPYANFFLHAGDLINTANSDNEWEEWFEAGGWIHGAIPCVASPGNHEYGRDPQDNTKRSLSTFWKPQFALPENGLPGLERTNYTFDYQGARIISLDSNTRIDEQAKWLERTLQNNPNRWTFVTFHHPVYSTAKGRDNKAVREAWQPIFQKYRVTMVLQGHDHTYGRRNVPTGVTGVDAKSGTVYVVSVSGPKMYRLGEEATTTMPRVAEYTQLYQLIRVSDRMVKFEAYTVTGELYDAFEITKGKRGENLFRDRSPKSPNRVEKSG